MTTADVKGDTRHALMTDLFHGLQGTWTLDRSLKSDNASEPSGRCSGTATFTPRHPSSADQKPSQDVRIVEEMLYHETGILESSALRSTASSVSPMSFERKYIWRMMTLDSCTCIANRKRTEGSLHTLSIWFTKPGTDKLDYIFHELDADFEPAPWQSHGDELGCMSLKARGSHLCVEDQYETEYIFHSKPIEPPNKDASHRFHLQQWKTIHIVAGPKKSQRIATTFTRSLKS